MQFEIPVKKPKSKEVIHAIVDEQDYWLKRWKWSSWKGARNAQCYPVRGIRNGNKVFQLHMSRIIAGAFPGEKVEHLDGVVLNMRRMNLLVDGVCLLDLTDREPVTQFNYNQYLSVFI